MSAPSTPPKRVVRTSQPIAPKQHLGNVDFPTSIEDLARAFETCNEFTLTQDYTREHFDKEVANYREMGWEFEKRWERREFVKEYHAELDMGNVVIVDKAAKDLKAAVWIYFDDCMLQSEKLEKSGQYRGFRVESTRAAVASLAPTAQNGSNGSTASASLDLFSACCQIGGKDCTAGSDGMMLCGKCLNAIYCGTVHQRSDWKDHKKYCREATPYARACFEARQTS